MKALQAKSHEAEIQGVELPLHREDVSWLTWEDPHSGSLGCLPGSTPTTTKKVLAFSIDHGVLYQWMESKYQFVVPGPLQARVLSLAHDSTLAGHLDPEKTLNWILQQF